MARSILCFAIIFGMLHQTLATIGLPSYARGGLLGRMENEQQKKKLTSIFGGEHLASMTHGCVQHNLTVPLDWFGDVLDNTMTIRYWVVSQFPLI